MIAKLKDMSKARDGQWVISFTTPEDFTEMFDQLADKDVTVEIKQRIRHRSLDANAYCWVLVDQIAKHMGIKKAEVYRNAIREIGGVSDTICCPDIAVDRVCENWEKNGLGWQTERYPSKLHDCTNVILYYGSSVYDDKQMSQLIGSLIQDAEALGIPTITEKEEKRLLGQWAAR